MNLNNEFSHVKPEHQVTLVNLYNAHFTGSASWDFNSVPFQQLVNSWNVNIRVIYDLDWATHNYLCEELTGGKHAKQMLYKRFVNFLSSVAKNRRQALVTLLNTVKSDCRSLTGGNLRKILLETGVKVQPGVTKGYVLSHYRVYETPAGQEWRVPLLQSLLEIRDDRWSLQFDEETGNLNADEITTLINNVCVS